MNTTIVILANSVKNGEHCVAGKCLRTKRWFRPVADFNGKELNKKQIQVTNSGFNGTYDVKPLQKINMQFIQQAPLINQPENWLIDPQWQWTQHYNLRPHELSDYLDYPESLWGNGNKISFLDIQSQNIIITNSLYLINVSNLELYYDSRYDYPKRKARFNYNNNSYDLSATDPNFDSIIQRRQTIDSAILCMSLGQPFSVDNCCYKLVASIFTG